MLTVAYMTLPGEREDWLQEMLMGFDGSGITPIHFPGIYQNLGLARVQAYEQINTKYVCMVDPDDRVYPEVFQECVDFLEANPDHAACGTHEEMINVKGRVFSRRPFYPVSLSRLMYSTLEFHNLVVFRTDVVKQYMHKVLALNFYNFDWALMLCVVGNHKVHKLNKVGYQFRRKPSSHSSGVLIKDGQVKPVDTARVLQENGLLPVTV